MSRRELYLAVLMIVMFSVGFLGHSLPATLPWMLALTPYFLFVFGVLALLPVLLEKNTSLYLWAAIVLVATFLIEALGTATGRIFGPYTYGATLAPKLLKVPVVIAFNWVLVILGALILARMITRKPVPAAVLGAALAAGFDLLLEPTAMRLDYWSWTGVNSPAGIPVQNYVAWFVIALASGLPFTLLRIPARSRVPAAYFLIQAAFFGALRIFPPQL
ncbi:MAG: carotenoid biosynthesis protein [Spirochaetales bacterium]|nr:carotenoid biosynthesis protein [Spirochaetales bacterium]